MMHIMRKAMVTRSELKEASLLRILTAGAARLRAEGLAGAAIVPVMQEAGLTHGAFYAHFSNKEDLAAAWDLGVLAGRVVLDKAVLADLRTDQILAVSTSKKSCKIS